MKAAIIIVNKNVNAVADSLKAISIMQSFFSEKNISISQIQIVNNKEESLLKVLNYLKNEDINKIFIIADQSDFANLKILFAKFSEVQLEPNLFAKNAITSLAKKFNVSVTKKILNEANLPANSRGIKSNLCLNAGFIADYVGKQWFLVPKSKVELMDMMEVTLMPYLETELKKAHFAIYIRAFNISAQEVTNLLSDVIFAYKDLTIEIEEDGLETKLVIKYSVSTPKVIVDNVSNIIYERLQPYILSDLNMDIVSLSFELLKIYNKKVSIVDILSDGLVISKFLSSRTDSASFIGQALILPNVSAIAQEFEFDKDFVEKNIGSEELAYEIAAKMLEKGNCDFAIGLTGTIVHKGSNANAQICMAIGNAEAIRIYNNVFDLEDFEAIKQITQIMSYYLIRNLKKL